MKKIEAIVCFCSQRYNSHLHFDFVSFLILVFELYFAFSFTLYWQIYYNDTIGQLNPCTDFPIKHLFQINSKIWKIIRFIDKITISASFKWKNAKFSVVAAPPYRFFLFFFQITTFYYDAVDETDQIFEKTIDRFNQIKSFFFIHKFYDLFCLYLSFTRLNFKLLFSKIRFQLSSNHKNMRLLTVNVVIKLFRSSRMLRYFCVNRMCVCEKARNLESV